MSFRGKLVVFFTIIVIVPMAAVAVVLFRITSDSETGKADARIAQGLQTALAVYQSSATRARPALREAARDPDFSRALARADRGAINRHARRLLRDLALQEIAFYDRAGKRVGGARRAPAVAFATAAPSTGKGRLGTLAVSRTSAKQYVGVVSRLTGLQVRVVSGAKPLASSLEELTNVPVRSGRADIGGEQYRARYQRVSAPPLPPLSLGVLDRVDTGAISDSRLLIAGILLAFLVLALVSSILIVARGLQRQLADFLQAAKRLGQGDFDHPVPIQGHDEFAELGVEFNKMSVELAAHIAEVERKRAELEETIRRVGEAVASGLDRQGLVELVVRTAVEACAAEGGRALPIDLRKMQHAEVGVTTPELAKALEAAERGAFEIHPGTGRELLAGLEPGNDGDGIPDHLPTVAKAGSVHGMALPMRARVAGGRDVDYVGVVSIGRKGFAFSEEERELFAYLIGQAVVSIENVDLHEAVQQQAVTDELTGLVNVRRFQEQLDQEIERSGRFGTPLSLVMIDIDNFKSVNDTYGHQQGDLVLIEVARTLRRLSRDVDVPARYGGEEMAVILPQTDLPGAEQQAERMRAAIEGMQIHRLDGRGTLPITASFGVASFPGEGREKGALIGAADAALYRAKRAGKNRVERAVAEPAAT
jgi:diguanylate cyclase (GGDEF)-like protein